MHKTITKLIASVGVLGLVGSLVAYSVALALDTATVGATVTVQNIAVSVDDADHDHAVAYGTLGNDSTMSTCGDEKNDAQTITNTGNVNEDFVIKAIANASTPDWTIGDAAASDVYVHKFQNGACTLVSGFSGTTLDTTGKPFASGVAPEGTATLNLQIHTPNPSTSYDQQTVDVTITASAS